ncbi:MAG TPA: NTP transferase domain-containing protein [Solirubrobacteraceae bacterium]|jgi:CTP:molybdopterin cytidylyltransferase MocA|nr:NTP transferase domain-containing protein [Solirubrobacteraceae bacterium]
MRLPANSNHRPVGVILAGGPGTRIGGGKPSVALRGEALLRYPLRAMKLALHDVTVVTKAEIMRRSSRARWSGSSRSGPWCHGLCSGATRRRRHRCSSRPQAVAWRWRRWCRGCTPALLGVEDEVELFDVDTPDDLLQAAAMMDARSLRISRR